MFESSMVTVTRADITRALEMPVNSFTRERGEPVFDRNMWLAKAIYQVSTFRQIVETCGSAVKHISIHGRELCTDKSATVMCDHLAVDVVRDSTLIPSETSYQSAKWRMVFQRETRHFNALLSAIKSGQDPTGLKLGLWAPKIYSVLEPKRPVVFDFVQESFPPELSRLITDELDIAGKSCDEIVDLLVPLSSSWSDLIYPGWCIRK